MTVSNISRASNTRWKKLGPFPAPEIPATRFHFINSGSLRPKLGLLICSLLLIGGIFFIILSPLENLTKMAHKETETFIKANKEFTGQLFPALTQAKSKSENVVMSPISINTILSLLYTGADGKTAQEMQNVMKLVQSEEKIGQAVKNLFESLQDNKDCTLSLANGLFVHENYKLVEKFVEISKNNFQAEIASKNYVKEADKSRTEINSWVENKTNEKIKDLLPQGSIDSLTRLVMVNAIYFKGKWAEEFNKKDTMKADFHLNSKDKIQVDMMRKSGEYSGLYDKSLKAEVLEVPYKGNKTSMLFFLPSDSEPQTLDLFEKNWGSFDFAGFKAPQMKHDLHVPRFKFETTHELNEPLKKLGLNQMFHQAESNFAKMTPTNDLYVSSAFQKAFIEVNEEGTEAAAATGVIMMTRMAVRVKRFILDRPFYFAIKHNPTGAVLFMGKVMNPN